MAIEPLTLVNGISCIIYSGICAIVGLKIASRYFKFRNKVFLFMGISWALVASVFWPASLSILLYLTTGQGLSLQMFLLIGHWETSWLIVLITAAYTEIKFKAKQKILILITVIHAILMNIYLFYFAIIDPSIIGVHVGITDNVYHGAWSYYLIFVISFVVFIGILISLESLKSDNPEIKLKGKFLLAAWILCFIGCVLDALLTHTIFSLFITRLILVLSSLLFYFGFFLPHPFKKSLATE